MEKHWIFRGMGADKNLVQFLLSQRGVDENGEEEFLSDRPQLTYDPFLLKDMEAGVKRILSGILAGEEICIYGDYDADGVCSISLLLEILKKLGAKVSYYIPSRFEEGYGLNKEALKTIRDRGVSLVVTVDCGSNSFAEVEYAKELGLDVIVTDHHNKDSEAVACLLINPRQADCRYPEKELSGCGVAFKLAQGLQRVLESNPSEYPGMAGRIGRADLNAVLDLVAIATVGDIVPLLGENRTLVKYGLRVINSGRRPGLARLIRETSLKEGEIKSENLAYVIVPHLNAAGRLLTAETGVTLLTSEDPGEIRNAIAVLTGNNRERRQKQEEAYKESIAIVEDSQKEDRVLVVYAPFAHEGIAGIVAGKLKETYHRPAILVTPTEKGSLKGTGRSVEGINLYEMLSASRRLFDKFGGHAGACGFQMKAENLPLLREDLRVFAESIFQKDPALFQPKLLIDAEVRRESLTTDFIKTIEKFEPFGHKNQKPVLCLRDIRPNAPVYMGDNRQHVRFSATELSFILFNRADEYRDWIDGSERLDLAGYVEIDRYRSGKIQFVVLDIRCYNEKAFSFQM